MNFKHASADEPPSTHTGMKGNGKESASKAREPRERETKDDWTTVEREQRRGKAKRRAGIVSIEARLISRRGYIATATGVAEGVAGI